MEQCFEGLMTAHEVSAGTSSSTRRGLARLGCQFCIPRPSIPQYIIHTRQRAHSQCEQPCMLLQMQHAWTVLAWMSEGTNSFVVHAFSWHHLKHNKAIRVALVVSLLRTLFDQVSTLIDHFKGALQKGSL